MLFKGFNLTELSEFDYVVQGAQPREGERERETETETETERQRDGIVLIQRNRILHLSALPRRDR